MLEAQDLAARRGDAGLFADLDFALEPGVVLFVRGANGSGKTTLLRILAGVTQAAAGRGALGGRPVGPFAPRFCASARFSSVMRRP